MTSEPTTPQQKPEDLLELMNSKRRVYDKLSILYPALLKKKPSQVTAKDLAEEALTLEVWPLYEQWEANVLLRTHDARNWLNDADSKGIRNAYKTPKRGRQPFHESKQEELQFDIWEKVKAGQDYRDALRSDITNYKLAFGKTPTGPSGERLPAWVWTDEDDKMFDLIEGRQTLAKSNADPS